MEFWQHVTRLGEAQILLPAAVTLLLWLALRLRAQRLALAWTGGVLAAAFITTATKVAYIGWGVGLSALDFTGISGHAMFAAAIYPLLFASLACALPPRTQMLALGAGVALALLVGVSRLEVGAHSVSEVVAGLMLGGTASALAWRSAQLPQRRLPWWIPLGVAAWLVLSPTHAPPSRSHDKVTQLSLWLSGHAQPYLRRALLHSLVMPTGHASGTPLTR